MKFVDDFKNTIDFFLRDKTKFTKKNYFVEQESLEKLFEGQTLARENELKNKYDFSLFQKGMSVQNYIENLYLLDILDKYIECSSKSKLKVLDIGCKNWFYAKSEYVFFNKYVEKLILKGIEIDAHRVCSNLYSRYEIAKFYIKDLKNIEYISQDFLTYDEKMDFMVWVLPFVREYPHLKWGLPLKYFCPKKMLWHAYFSLSENGKIFIVNQGEEEYEIQKNLLEECAIPYEETGEIKSDFSCYNHKRYGLLITKKGPDDRIS